MQEGQTICSVHWEKWRLKKTELWTHQQEDNAQQDNMILIKDQPISIQLSEKRTERSEDWRRLSSEHIQQEDNAQRNEIRSIVWRIRRHLNKEAADATKQHNCNHSQRNNWYLQQQLGWKIGLEQTPESADTYILIKVPYRRCSWTLELGLGLGIKT